MKNPALTIPLSYPIEHEGEEINALNLRRPRLREIKLFTGIRGEEGEQDEMKAFDSVIELTAALSDLPVDVIEDIDAADVERVMDMVSDFFEKAVPQSNGEGSQPKSPPS